MTDIKLCKNCKHVKVGTIQKIIFGYRYAQCNSPKRTIDIDVISGKEIMKGYSFCEFSRSSNSKEDCGKNANFFEEK
ncbi:MAG: hypothetical protein V4440_14610 [Pseudomonadota bacterium]